MARSWKDLSLEEAVLRAKGISRQALHIAIKTYVKNGRADIVEQLLQVRKTLKYHKRIEKVGKDVLEARAAKKVAKEAEIKEFEASCSLPVPGFEGKWSVTTDGRVWSHKQDKWLKPTISTKKGRGYLYLNGKLKSAYVHRLVALAFIPNPLNCRNVRHKDGNRYNNTVENLEWFGKERSTT